MMDVFWKSAAGALITAVVYLVLAKRDKDIAAVLGITACCMIAWNALSCLKQVTLFIEKLRALTDLDTEMLQILWKSVCVAIAAQIAEHVCTDAGNSALGKTLQFLATASILILALPLMESLLTLIEKILGSE